MRTCLLRLLLLLCLFLSPTWGLAAVNLDAVGTARDVGAQSQWWLTSNSKAGIAEVASNPSPAVFSPNGHDKTYRLSEDNRLWLRLDVQRSPQSPAIWVLSVPLPFLDKVTLYQPNATGDFNAFSAGDRIAVAQWPERARYPLFRINLPEGTQTLYMQIQGSTAANIPVVLASEAEANSDTQISYLGLGLVFGLLLLMVLVCGLQGYAYKDRVYALYGVYVLMVIVAIACYNGLAAQYLWDESPMWADNSQAVLGLLTSGMALFFVHQVTGVAAFSRRWSLGLLTLSATAIAVAVAFFILPRPLGVAMLGVYVTTSSVLGLWIALKTWRRGDRIGLWVAVAHAPLVVIAVIILLRALGLVSFIWVVQWGVVGAFLIEVSLLLMALQLRSRERHDAQNRRAAMYTHDPMTGLLSVHMFDDRLRQTIIRARRHREDAAIVLVRLVNYPQILAAYGTPTAEKSLLNAVLKLRQVLRDVDTASRVDEAYFGLILEGISARNTVTKAAARLVALGLMPLEGIKPEIALQFHFAGVILHEYVDDPEHIVEKLKDLLLGMSPRTRRPIRFLELPQTELMGLESESESQFGNSSDADATHSSTPPPLGSRL
jgi:two-component system, sensor histidine kinase LadS